MKLRASTGAVNSKIYLAQNAGDVQYWENSTFHCQGSGSTQAIFVGSAANQQPTEVTFNNCTVHFASSNNYITLISTRFRWLDGSLSTDGTGPNNLIALTSTGEGIDGIISGVDLSALETTSNLIKSGTAQSGRVH